MKHVQIAGALAVATMVGLSVVPVSAHHSAAPHYDLEKHIELKGVVTQFKFVNPHAYVFFDVTETTGKKTSWRCELAAATVLARLGWGLDIFPMKEAITIKGSPARREDNVCMLTSFIRADGIEITREADVTKLYANRPTAAKLAPSATVRPVRLADGHVNLAGPWMPAGRGGGPRGGGRPGAPGDAAAPGARAGRPGGPGGGGRGGDPATDATEAGLAASKKYDQKFDDPAIKCDPANIMFGWTHDRHVNEIVQTKDTITLKYGYMDFVRTIHMNAPHPKTVKPSRGGHSIGTWDGDVLVVDTVGFLPGVIVPLSGLMHSDKLHVVERFAVDAAAKTLTRTFVAEDPLYLKVPRTGSDTQDLTDEAPAKYNCVELSGKNNIRIK